MGTEVSGDRERSRGGGRATTPREEAAGQWPMALLRVHDEWSKIVGRRSALPSSLPQQIPQLARVSLHGEPAAAGVLLGVVSARLLLPPLPAGPSPSRPRHDTKSSLINKFAAFHVAHKTSSPGQVTAHRSDVGDETVCFFVISNRGEEGNTLNRGSRGSPQIVVHPLRFLFEWKAATK